MKRTLKLFSMALLLLKMTLPTESQEYFGCDIIDESTCIFQVANISGWYFYIDVNNQQPINEIKFNEGHFYELSSKTEIFYPYNTITIVNLSGNHIRSLSKFDFSLDVDTLLTANLSRNEIENLDSDSIFEAHPQLETIDLSFNRITSIRSEAFNGLSDLNELFLNENQLKEINELMFASLVKLKCLELSVNEIGKFVNEPFGALINLEELYLEKNSFSEFDVNILEANINLQKISLGNNGDHFLSLTGHFNSAANVKASKSMQLNFTASGRTVSITDSKISVLTIAEEVENVVASNSSITELCVGIDSNVRVGDFSKNSLTGHLSFENWRKIETLDLSFNQIQKVSFANRSTLLTNLNLSHNNLTSIQSIASLSSVKTLDLSFNCIEHFVLSTFSDMISLEVLNLRETCFSSLDYGTFSFQTKLRVLDISFNNLNTLDLQLLSTQSNLEDLFIDGNNLTSLRSMDLIGLYFPKLQSIGLTHNDWSCKTLSSFVNKLYQLRISLFVESSIKHTTNVKGIACTTFPFNSSQETLIIPKNPMSTNHTMYMDKIEKINEIVKTMNELKDTKNHRDILENAIKKDITELRHDKSVMKSKFDDQINQLNTFGKEIVNKFQLLNENNFKELMKMKVIIEKLHETNNAKYDLISESIESLKDKLKWIELNGRNPNENANKIVRDEIGDNSDYYDDISSLKALEIFLITLLLVLLIVALYYVLVYC